MAVDPLEQIVSKEALQHVFNGTDFGKVAPRSIIEQALLKAASGFYNGFTSEHILISLGLLRLTKKSKNRVLTRKGKDYLYEAFANK